MDAAEAVEVQYEELPFVLHSEDAMQPGAPTIWDQVPDNMTVETFFGDREATDRAFARAAHVVKKKFHIGRVTGVPMEPRSALGQYDAATDSYLLYAGSGGAVRQRNELIQVVGVPPERLRVISADVGGNFGTRNRTYVEFGLVLWAAKKLGRPVKYHRDALRSLSQRLPGPRSGDDCRARDRRQAPFHRHARHQYQQRRRALRVVVAAEQGLRPYSRLLCDSGDDAAFGRGVHQHDADQCVPQLGPAGSHLRHRAPGRRGGQTTRRRPHRAASQEPHIAEGDALSQLGRNALRQRALRREHGLGDGNRRLEGISGAAPRSQAPRQALGPRARQLCRVVDRSAEGAGAAQGAAARFVRAGPRRCRDRHAIERAGPRDELRPGGGRSASRSRRGA